MDTPQQATLSISLTHKEEGGGGGLQCSGGGAGAIKGLRPTEDRSRPPARPADRPTDRDRWNDHKATDKVTHARTGFHQILHRWKTMSNHS